MNDRNSPVARLAFSLALPAGMGANRNASPWTIFGIPDKEALVALLPLTRVGDSVKQMQVDVVREAPLQRCVEERG